MGNICGRCVPSQEACLSRLNLRYKIYRPKRSSSVKPGTFVQELNAKKLAARYIVSTQPLPSRRWREDGWSQYSHGENDEHGPSKSKRRFRLNLNERQQELVTKFWNNHIVAKQRDIFLEAMYRCIGASPKLNDIIDRGKFGFRNFKNWPKLTSICQSQYEFFDRIICEQNLDEDRLFVACRQLGSSYVEYAKYGLKPHFFDLFQQHFISLLYEAEWEDWKEKDEIISAYTKLINYMIDVMNYAYCQKMHELQLCLKSSQLT